MSKPDRIDGHFDLLMSLDHRRRIGQKNVIETQFLPSFRAGGFTGMIASVFIEDRFLPEMGLRKALDQIGSLYEDRRESQGTWDICKTYEDYERCRQAGRFGFFLSLEGADPLMNDLGLLRVFYELGIRFLGLVWSRRNYAADGCHFKPVSEGRKGGLTDFGVALLKKGEELGMIIDVSHLNDEGFEDVYAYASKPFIASHSNCRALMDTARNLRDIDIRRIAEIGGLIGGNAANIFIKDPPREATVRDFAKHLAHMKRLTGIDHVALGFDFCIHLREDSPRPSSTDTGGIPVFREIIDGHPELTRLEEALREEGFNPEEIEKVFGGNYARFLRAHLSQA
ncbi:MAG TPA: membrane dipeptidase [Thermotogota bacterium]|jgi:membrane dipeptidase|nr:membrane dipeptidase [Thermotogota bacterium]NLH18569.1 membrane dipeptidase [Thermotogaceae bacterium]OQC31337.1 MAG: Membrane dipeptidase (Peptidase family M19) [Thermotogota bacterium ADurb.Bin062]HNW47028.1 membrane dipeptidase [Thermotogota bacterium]HOD91198.1 membrane dipeptidase [Thermotogota bacterium]